MEVVKLIVAALIASGMVWLVWVAVKNPPASKAARPGPVVVASITGRRPTVTRVGLGLLFFGLPGALLGFAFRKKTRERILLP